MLSLTAIHCLAAFASHSIPRPADSRPRQFVYPPHKRRIALNKHEIFKDASRSDWSRFNFQRGRLSCESVAKWLLLDPPPPPTSDARTQCRWRHQIELSCRVLSANCLDFYDTRRLSLAFMSLRCSICRRAPCGPYYRPWIEPLTPLSDCR